MTTAESEILDTTSEIKNLFNGSLNNSTDDYKWTLLKDFHSKHLSNGSISLPILSSYSCIMTTLLDALKPKLFKEKWQEDIFDCIFLNGIHHEAFILLMQKLGESPKSYQQEKILNLLEKFIQEKCFTSLLLRQSLSSGVWDPEYAVLSKTWNYLITLITSLPERIANKSKGQMHKTFHADIYVPHIMSSILEVLSSLHQKAVKNQNCTLEFLGKLIGKFCILGFGDVVSKKLYMELIRRSDGDFIWRKLSKTLITKMSLSSLESLITNLLLTIPWYGYLEWILGEEGVDNRKLNYIMTTKLLFIRHFKQVNILRNIIGYFASKSCRRSHFWKFFKALVKSWGDEIAVKNQTMDQQKYLVSALIVSAGWIKEMDDISGAEGCIENILNGTTIRIGSSERFIRDLGIIAVDLLISAVCPKGPRLEYTEAVDKDLTAELTSLMVIPSKPDKDSLCSEGTSSSKGEKSEKVKKKKEKSEKVKKKMENRGESSKVLEIDSDDDLEPYDTSNDVPEEHWKRPFYLNDCLQGIIDQDDPEWFEQCLYYAVNLIESNSDTVHEVAVEMAKVMLHLENKFGISDFLAIRHRILVILTVRCPVMVVEYLTSQFYAINYCIRQRLDILEIIASSSMLLCHPMFSPKRDEMLVLQSEEKFKASTGKLWKTIVEQRVAAKTRHITKTKTTEFPKLENRFSAVAGYFFFPLIAKYDKKNTILNLFDDDSYVLGRLVYTLGIVMHASSNTPICQKMGKALLNFVADIRNHPDVFVREACIFATAVVFSSVPGYLLFLDDMTPLVFENKAWLENVIDNEYETSCQIQATYALGLIVRIIEKEMPLMCDILAICDEM